MYAVENKPGCIFKAGPIEALPVVETSEKSEPGCIFKFEEAEKPGCIFKVEEAEKPGCIFKFEEAEKPGCIFKFEEAEKPGCIFKFEEAEKPGCIFKFEEVEKPGCIFKFEEAEKPGCIFKFEEAEKPGCIFKFEEAQKPGCIFKAEGETKLETVADYYARLDAWDFSIIKAHAVRKGLFSAAEVDDVCREYKRFMALSCAYKSSAVPVSKKVDEFWHIHIIFTEDYMAMCRKVAGGFLHHRPGILDEDVEGQSFDSNLSLYQASFGAPDSKWWSDVWTGAAA